MCVPDFTDERGCSALCLATRNGRQDAVEWLVKVGCNLDVQDRSGSTSLIHAVLGDQCKCGATLVSFFIIKK
jgi:ankyrin repeat protein